MVTLHVGGLTGQSCKIFSKIRKISNFCSRTAIANSWIGSGSSFAMCNEPHMTLVRLFQQVIQTIQKNPLFRILRCGCSCWLLNRPLECCCHPPWAIIKISFFTDNLLQFFNENFWWRKWNSWIRLWTMSYDRSLKRGWQQHSYSSVTFL